MDTLSIGKDAWNIIASYCEWNSFFALRLTCSALRRWITIISDNDTDSFIKMKKRNTVQITGPDDKIIILDGRIYIRNDITRTFLRFAPDPVILRYGNGQFIDLEGRFHDEETMSFHRRVTRNYDTPGNNNVGAWHLFQTTPKISESKIIKWGPFYHVFSDNYRQIWGKSTSDNRYIHRANGSAYMIMHFDNTHYSYAAAMLLIDNIKSYETKGNLNLNFNVNLSYEEYYYVDGNMQKYISISDSDITYYDAKGHLHRNDGPAKIYFIANELKWFKSGKLHRDNGPAIYKLNSEIYLTTEIFPIDLQYRYDFFTEGILTNIVIVTDTSKKYYKCVKPDKIEHYHIKLPTVEYSQSNALRNVTKLITLHRDDGPADVSKDGSQCYYQNGIKHREDGPAEILPNGTKRWFYNGLLHRRNGPAVTTKDGKMFWYTHGKCIKSN